MCGSTHWAWPLHDQLFHQRWVEPLGTAYAPSEHPGAWGISEVGDALPRLEKKAQLAKESEIMLWTILVILVILWLLGFIGHFGGNLIHILIVVAVIILIYNLVAGRRSV